MGHWRSLRALTQKSYNSGNYRLPTPFVTITSLSSPRIPLITKVPASTGASTATISRVNKCLVYGSDGYRKMLDRLKEDETAEESHE